MIRPINITAVSNGFIVQVGCQQVVFTSVGDLCDLLSKYLRNPEDTEKNFMATAVNVRHTLRGGLPVSEATGQVYVRAGHYAGLGDLANRDPRHPNSLSEYTDPGVPVGIVPGTR